MEADAAQQGPTEWDAARASAHVQLKDRSTLHYVGSAGHPQGSHDVGSCQANRPVPRDQLLYYFEITVRDAGESGKIGIGFASTDFRAGRQPGWEKDSYGFHGDDGHKFCAQSYGTEYGPRFSTGDTVGACLHLENRQIFFTKNGKHLGIAFRDVQPTLLFPTVGLHSKNECVEVNFGSKPFQFDIQAYVQMELDRRQADINSNELAVGVSHQVVRQYLVQYGYADTLAAFDRVGGYADPNVPAASTSGAGTVGEATLQLRKGLRQQLACGDVAGCVDVLRKQFPQLLTLQPSTAHLRFWLSCQEFIELIRVGNVEGALQLAQSDLRVLSGHLEQVAMPQLPAEEAAEFLQDTVALIAYEDAFRCPYSAKLGQAQRERVADVVNAAVLQATAGGGCGGKQPVGVTERLLQQLVAVHGEIWQCNGCQGRSFDLEKVINQ